MPSLLTRFKSWWLARQEDQAYGELIAYCWKRLQRHRDRLAPKQEAALRIQIQKTDNALQARAPDVGRQAEALGAAWHRAFPEEKHSAWRENGEVILVALVVAMAVRAYFLQPFKIPTGSMQPTLNGVTLRTIQPHERTWWYRAICLPIFGERVIRFVAEQEGSFEGVRTVRFGPLHYGGQRGFFSLLPMEATQFRVAGRDYTFPCELQKFESEVLHSASATKRPRLSPQTVFHKGDTILECVVQTGDQLFVDRFTYNFRKPQRGDVFVFETKDLPVSMPGDFYIKRLAGLPGDTLEIRDPNLLVNGAVIESPAGFGRVMSLRDGYRGYTSRLPGQIWLRPEETKHLNEHEYFALGDNSFFSADSRMWGIVPYKNIVGRGFFVYWPFTRHFGRVE